MKILYITHFFPPELNGGARRVYDLSKNWVKMGHEVTVSTGFPSHPTGIVPEEYRGKWVVDEHIDGIHILRTKKFTTPNKGFFLRVLNHLSLAISAFIINFIRNTKYDIVIATSPPLFVGFSAVLLKKLKKIPYVFEVRDLWPQQAIDLGILKNKFLIKIARKIETYFYKQSGKVVVVANGSKSILTKQGIRADKIILIRNGVDLDNFDISKAIEHKLDLFKDGDFIVSYFGTMGASQGLLMVLKAAKILQQKNVNTIKFLLAGDGIEKTLLVNYVSENKLSNVHILPVQPFEIVKDLYRLSNLVLVPLKKNELFKHTVPSKLYEIMACKVPLLITIEGESKSIVEEANCGFFSEPENEEALVNKILEIMKLDNKHLSELGENGREWVENYSNRAKHAQLYIMELMGINNN